MKSSTAALGLAIAAAAAAASPDPQVTARAQPGNLKRQADPALLGYISTEGASSFSDLRTCDFPYTLSTSSSLAQCCSGPSCVFWSACSAGTLFAGAGGSGSTTSLRCDRGYCNTAVLVETAGAGAREGGGVSYLGCWETGLGEGAFTIVRDVGAIASPTATASDETPTASSTLTSTPTPPSSKPSLPRPASTAPSRTTTTTAAGESAASTTPSAAAAVKGKGKSNAAPLAGAFGLLAVVCGGL